MISVPAFLLANTAVMFVLSLTDQIKSSQSRTSQSQIRSVSLLEPHFANELRCLQELLSRLPADVGRLIATVYHRQSIPC